MIRAFRHAYVLAKAYGMMSRTWVGRAWEDLVRLRKLEDLAGRLFPGEKAGAAGPPEPSWIENRIGESAIRSMLVILSLMGRQPPDVLVHLLRFYEYQSLKSVVRGIVNGAGDEPRIWNIGPYANIHLEGTGNFEKAIGSSAYAWILPHLHQKPLFEVENLLDRDYYERLLRLVKDLPAADRRGTARLVNLEIALVNVTWALRLRFFFAVEAEAAQALLIPGMSDAHRRALRQVFEIPADSAEGWRRWRFSWMIEDQIGEGFRGPDPVRAEQKAARRLSEKTHQLFHQDPFTLTPLAAFFRLKQFEASLLMTTVEGLRLSLTEQEVLAFSGGA